MDVRKAAASDIEATVEMAERNRRQYQKYQPTFWRKHPQSAAMTQIFFTRLLTEPGTFFLVAVEGSQLLGFLIARKFPSSPVFDPGGDTYLIDDFCVIEPQYWLTIGEALLSHASTLIHEHGAAQILVTCADRDLAKTEVLRRSELTIASNWWTKALS
ncbi:MAG: GNAT family N-acetyltransferase [Rhodospirillales bacterium]|nr:GNAT family N-acetyltransferase [Rhodospirillales bacterium]